MISLPSASGADWSMAAWGLRVPANAPCVLGTDLNCSESGRSVSCHRLATDKKIQPFHFFEPVHQEIFGWLCEMQAQGQRPTVQLLNVKLGVYGRTDIGGIPLTRYTARLAAEATTGVNVPDFCDVGNVLKGRQDLFRRPI